MEVILKKDVAGLGKTGETAKVKDGFALNYLIPKGLAVAMTVSNLKQVEQEKERRTVKQEKAIKEAEALRDKLAAISLTIPVLVQEDEKLYGSIAAADLSVSLKEEGFDIDKNIIFLEEPIKALGIYEVPVKLHPEVPAKVKVWVVKK